MGFGTNAVFDDLASFPYPVADFGLDQAFDAIEDLFEAQNKLVSEQLMLFVDTTTLPFMVSSAPDQTTTQELEEFATPNPQKIISGQQIGFPLRKFGAAWQATYGALNVMPAKELAAQATATANAALRRVQQRLRNALYSPMNYSFYDKWADRRQQFPLPIKALANADGFPIPVGPNGETFNASTHNHYLATVGSSVAQSDYDALILTVMEHYNMGTPMLIINAADLGFVRSFVSANGAGTFAPDVDVRVIQPLTQLYANQALDITNLYNRRVGIYNGVEVWVKPWAIATYPVCIQTNTNRDKPLMKRERKAGSSGLKLVFEGYGHPLAAKVWEDEYDIAVYDRVAAAVLDTTHQTNYTVPSAQIAAA